MFNMGGGELIVVALFALILIKPDKLPGVATALGRWFHDLRRGIGEVKRSFESTLKEEPKKPTGVPTSQENSGDCRAPDGRSQ